MKQVLMAFNCKRRELKQDLPVRFFGDFRILTYLLTPWSRVLLEKLTVNFAASQEIPSIYGT
jgi:hypothetical protein